MGDNCRIGANCVVVKDMPDNSTAVLRNIDIIIHDIAFLLHIEASKIYSFHS